MNYSTHARLKTSEKSKTVKIYNFLHKKAKMSPRPLLCGQGVVK
jgi:hypothetical protein